MLVSVTGGTGFVGIHSVAAMVRQGHAVRLLVRDPSAAERALGLLAVDPGAVDLVVGDVTDEGSVARAVRGADAVLHAASVYSFDSRRHAAMRRTNARGTAVVLRAARKADAERIIHVSSIVALLPSDGRPLREDSPVGRPRETYMATKAAAERIARRHQREGAPVVITYPPALLGPSDPGLGDQNARLRNTLRGLMPIWPLGGFPVGDVRDTAELHARLLTAPKSAPDRHFAPGRQLSTRQYVRTLREATGRRLPAVFLPARAMLPVGALAGLVQRVWPRHIPAEYGAVYTCACAVPVDPDASTCGLAPRPVAETMADTVRWLHGQGHLTDRQIGLLAEGGRG
ncbi:NAD-dependent epimerase/dehydratase family protein [Streptomyces sp. FH025]|uniref:NAD-dependent epimerase/dehydratase family protein n=1 Tax=Streptomyces sp. FH025 TaxID=2815937 RepID=UPI001A9D920A|nr:NAD-dependent epimerase/dehydratase family protein [Streptomyces sp. FH025]MBO1418045.1 NAD-dependent epimerase/dehydratase family protein [Streptomyces sp. FH025]